MKNQRRFAPTKTGRLPSESVAGISGIRIMPSKARIDAPDALHHIILLGTSMTLGGVLTGEQVRLRAVDSGG